jgi:hypothetical protein
MDFHEIWKLRIVLTFRNTFQFSLKLNKNNEHFTWILHTFLFYEVTLEMCQTPCPYNHVGESVWWHHTVTTYPCIPRSLTSTVIPLVLYTKVYGYVLEQTASNNYLWKSIHKLKSRDNNWMNNPELFCCAYIP